MSRTYSLDFPLTRRGVVRLLGTGAGAGVLWSANAEQNIAFPTGAVIRTVLKDYDPQDLTGGAILFHEHLQLGRDFRERFTAAADAARAANGLAPAPPRPGGNATAPYIANSAELVSEEVIQARVAGVACIVDAGHPDTGRDINFIRQVSMKSGLPVVAGGGFYTQPFYPKKITTMSEEQIVKALIKQADDDTLGAFGEVGSWDEITSDERKVFRAVGKAHLATNLPIFTHTGIPGKSALEQLDLLEDAGVKPERVVIGHLGNLIDPSVYVQKTICRRGAFIGFDRQGRPSDADQVPMVVALIEAGYAGNLMFSSDATNDFGRTLTQFLPKLKAAGVDEKVLHRIMVDNPRRFLAFVPYGPPRAHRHRVCFVCTFRPQA